MEILEIRSNEIDCHKINQAREIYHSYFSELYREVPSEILGIKNLQNYLEEIFNKTELALKEKSVQGFLAYDENRPVGFATCGFLEDVSILLLRTLPVHLAFKNKEVEIRAAFLGHFKEQFPGSKRVVMMVRKVNEHQSDLCLNTGFVKDNEVFSHSIYLKNTYHQDWYNSFVLDWGHD